MKSNTENQNSQALCGDCLRKVTGSVDEIQRYHTGDTPCVCGGCDVCACTVCVELLEGLEGHDFSSGPFVSPELQAPIVSWTPNEGCGS